MPLSGNVEVRQGTGVEQTAMAIDLLARAPVATVLMLW